MDNGHWTSPLLVLLLMCSISLNCDDEAGSFTIDISTDENKNLVTFIKYSTDFFIYKKPTRVGVTNKLWSLVLELWALEKCQFSFKNIGSDCTILEMEGFRVLWAGVVLYQSRLLHLHHL